MQHVFPLELDSEKKFFGVLYVTLISIIPKRQPAVKILVQLLSDYRLMPPAMASILNLRIHIN
jgi:hypothetical protein